MANTSKKIAKLAGTPPRTHKELLERLELLPVDVVHAGRHLRVEVAGSLRGTVASTPSCSRQVLNTVFDLRRNGVDVRAMRVTS